jgi:hypothetical protein
MLRSREGAQSKKFRLAAAIAFSYDYRHIDEPGDVNPAAPAVKREAEEDWGRGSGSGA